jgi:UDP-GlcNAc:undecaprenyl-phosphate GlcNAc-1-phosphate transferase
LGIRNVDESVIRWATQSKPAFGGISFYILFLVSSITYSFFFSQNDLFLNPGFLGLLASCTLAFMMGLADDAYNTRPFLKFLAQVICGVILFYSNSAIHIFKSDFLNLALTVTWVAGLMNSINMLDNMDGITTTVSMGIIFSIILIVITRGETNSYDLIMLVGIFAALGGFLVYNWNPSKMYMGDTGSQFLGAFLAAISIKHLWNAEPVANQFALLKNVLLVGLVFVLPLTDTLTVVINRLKRGQSPFIGGKDHTTHHLSYLGLTDKNVARTFAGISFTSAILAYLLYTINTPGMIMFSLFMLYVIVVFTSLFIVSRIKKQKVQLKQKA